MTTVSEHVKDLRRKNGWSQKDLAKVSGVNQDTISGLESGRHEPRPSTLRKLAQAFKVEVADFFREPAAPKVEASPPSFNEWLAARYPDSPEKAFRQLDALTQILNGERPEAFFPDEGVDAAETVERLTADLAEYGREYARTVRRATSGRS